MPKFDDGFKEEHKEYSDLILQMLWNRNLKEKDEIKNFLEAGFSDLHDPFLFKDMKEAIDLIIKHIKAQNRIYIYGDYDADGVTSSALLFEVLKIFKADVEVYIPHRVTEGYGLNALAVDFMSKEKCKLIVTVDGGIRSKNEVEKAKEMGIDVVVTDHHIPPEDKKDYPNCLIIDPAIKEEPYPDKGLAGVGVAFKLATALIQKSKLNDGDKKILIKRVLDLVAIGTVADCVKLRNENRLLLKSGLKQLNKTKRIGLLELVDVAGIKNKDNLESWNIGFQIGPRINAAGRMEHANTAYKLLISKDKREAKKLAVALNERNIDRQKTTGEIFDKVENQVRPDEDTILIGVCDAGNRNNEDVETWNEGVIGLVAGRICSKYYRPSLVITETEDGYKGSGRSIPDFNLIEAIEECRDVLMKYGGHPAACGFSLRKDQLSGFVKKIREVTNEKLKTKDLFPKIDIEHELDFSLINEDLLDEVNLFAPFGQDNGKPQFVSRAVKIFDINFMGVEGQHLKYRVKQGSSRVFSALGFNQAEKWSEIKIGDMIDLVYTLELNEFNGRREVQMKIIDIHNS